MASYSSSDERRAFSTSSDLTDARSSSLSAFCNTQNNVSHSYALPMKYESSGSTPSSPMSTSQRYPLDVVASPSNVKPYGPIMVTLEDNEGLWEQFSRLGTEMIVAKQGRLMFPMIKIKIENLEPDEFYMVFLEIAPTDYWRYRFERCIWITKTLEHFSSPEWLHHPQSPAKGHKWMEKPVDFSVKLTNLLEQNNKGMVYIHSMHKYKVNIHIVKGSDENTRDLQEKQSFSLPKTTFISVTTYQNPKIRELKTEKNIHAKGTRDKKKRQRQSYEEDLKENLEGSYKRPLMDYSLKHFGEENEFHSTSNLQVTGLQQFPPQSPPIYHMEKRFYKLPDKSSNCHIPQLLLGTNVPDAFDNRTGTPLNIYYPSLRHHLPYSPYYNPYLHIYQQDLPFYHHMLSNFPVCSWLPFSNCYQSSNLFRTPALQICPGYSSVPASTSPKRTEINNNLSLLTTDTESLSSSSSNQSRPSLLPSEHAIHKTLHPQPPPLSADVMANLASSTNNFRNPSYRVNRSSSREELDSCHLRANYIQM